MNSRDWMLVFSGGLGASLSQRNWGGAIGFGIAALIALAWRSRRPEA